MLRDITEQQRLEEQLQQSQKMEAVGRLAGGVAHDFNNILGIISGYAELVQLNAADSSQKERADKILAAIDKAALLTKQLLAFGRKQVMLPKLLDLSAVVAEVSSMVTRFRDKWKLKRAAAGHCTGEFAFSEFNRVFGSKLDHAGVGAVIPLPR